MRDRADVEQRFVVGAVQDLEALHTMLSPLGASVVRTWPETAEGDQVVVVRVVARHAPGVAEQLGPNARIFEEEHEALEVAEAAGTSPEGAPYEARRGRAP